MSVVTSVALVGKHLVGKTIRVERDGPWVTVLKVTRDSYGYDVLYQHNGGAPRWHGFGVSDYVDVRL